VGTNGPKSETKGLLIVHPCAQRYRPYLEHAIGPIRAIIAPFDGAWLEDKTLMLTVHYLAVRPDERAILCECLNVGLEPYKGLLTAVESSAATGILPDVGWAKRDTIWQIIEAQGSATLPLYVGSEDSDERAFQLVAESRGVTIGVGPFAPQNAMHRLPSPDRLTNELTTFLSLLSYALKNAYTLLHVYSHVEY
jgi:trehalose-6-phosphatase